MAATAGVHRIDLGESTPPKKRVHPTTRTKECPVKRLLATVTLVLAVPCVAIGQAKPPKTAPWPGSAAPLQPVATKPGPECKKLEQWVGDWTYEEVHQATPFQHAGTFTGKASVRPILRGFFVEWYAEENEGDAWREIDGYDPIARRYFWYAFYADGSVEVMAYTMEGDTVSMSGHTVIGGKPAGMRGTGVFTPDSRGFVYKYEVSLDGKTWIPSGEMRFAKTK